VYRTTWSIGYVEHACSQALLPFAAIRNQAGNYVIPSAQSVAADAAWKPGITPADFSVVNQPGAASYRSAATAGRWPAPTRASE
jgi:phosphate transport system substrate-binding protein